MPTRLWVLPALAICAVAAGFGTGQRLGPDQLQGEEIPCPHERCYATPELYHPYECRAAEDELECVFYFEGESCGNWECEGDY